MYTLLETPPTVIFAVRASLRFVLEYFKLVVFWANAEEETTRVETAMKNPLFMIFVLLLAEFARDIGVALFMPIRMFP